MRYIIVALLLSSNVLLAQHGTVNPKIDNDFELIGDNITHYEDMTFSHMDKGFGIYSIAHSDWSVKTTGEIIVAMYIGVSKSSYGETMAAFKFYCSKYGEPIQKMENATALSYIWMGYKVKISFYFLTLTPDSHSYIVHIDAV